MFIANIILNTNFKFMFLTYFFVESFIFIEKLSLFKFFNLDISDLDHIESLESIQEDDFFLDEGNFLFMTIDDEPVKGLNKTSSKGSTAAKKLVDTIMKGIIVKVNKISNKMMSEVFREEIELSYTNKSREEDMNKLRGEIDDIKKEVVARIRDDLIKDFGIDITKEIVEEVDNIEVLIEDPEFKSGTEIIEKIIKEIRKKVIKELEKNLLKIVTANLGEKPEIVENESVYEIDEDGTKIKIITNEVETEPLEEEDEFEFDFKIKRIEEETRESFLYKNLL
jgi:hypothetical protein